MAKKARFRNDIRIENRKARFDYEILETVEAGVALTGCEVKSIREGKASLSEVYAMPRGSELLLRGMHISPYNEGRGEMPDPYRDRKLLLHRKQMDKMIGGQSTQGYSIVPLRLYFNEKGIAKIEIALCRGKKVHDKREAIKKRDNEREVRREFKTR